MKTRLLGTTLLIGLVLISGCKKAQKAESQAEALPLEALKPVKNDRLVLWLESNPSILNPVLASDAYAQSVTSNIFDYLITYDVMTGEAQGQLAESWTVSKDGLIYEFKIRKNAVFHDGKPVTAEDVKFTFDSIKDPKVDAAHLQNYFNGLSRVEVVDPHTVRFIMKEPYFRNLIIVGRSEILPKHIYGQGDFNKNPANREPIGSGPYKFVKWDTGRAIELRRFEKYWGNEDSFFKSRNNFNLILYRIITEQSVAVMSMKRGDIDSLEPSASMFVTDFGAPEYEKKFYKLKYSTQDGAGYGYVGWNLKSPVFASKKVRMALAHAMPREEINQKLYKGIRTLSVVTFPQGSDKTDPSLKPVPYDLKTASELLAEDGWKKNASGELEKDGKKFSFELLFTAGVPDSERVALIFQQSLKQLGIALDLRALEWTVFLKQMNEGKFDAVMLGWGSSLDGDPFQIWHSSQAVKGGSNRVGFKNNRVDQILTEARKTLDRGKRNTLYQEFSRILYDEQPYLFLFERPHLQIVDRRFEGVLPVGKLGVDSSRWYTPLGREKYKQMAHPE